MVAAVVAVAVLTGPGIVRALAEKRLDGTCGIVVDRSASSTAEGFGAHQQIETALPRFLANAGCRHVVFGPIDSSSNVSGCTAQPLDLDPDSEGGVDRTQLWNQRRLQAKKYATDILDCTARQDKRRGGSDVLGGIGRIARQRPPGTERFPLLVISDFIQHDHEVDLTLGRGQTDISTPAARMLVLNKLVSERRVPALSGIDVYAAGYALGLGGGPVQFERFDAFWWLLMGRAQCAHFYPEGPRG